MVEERPKNEGGQAIEGLPHCSDDLGFFFEGCGNPQGHYTEEGWDLTRFGCQVGDKLGSGG